MFKAGTLAILSLSFWLLAVEKTAWAAVVIDFSALTQNDAVAHDIGPVYAAEGFVLTATHFSPIANPPSFNFFGTQSNLYPGATALFHHISQGEITLTRADGGAFDFYSIELAELPPRDELGNPVDSGPFNLTFFGTTSEGNPVSENVVVDSFLSLEQHPLSVFRNVIEVHWFQGAGGSNIPPDPTHQFTNLAVAEVPEPSTLTVVCFGLLLFGLGAPRCHRQRPAF